jgi:ATP-binding cassette, subfamily G (WHITE), member 2, PDR
MTGNTFICSVPGAVPGETTVSGDAYLQTNFEYSYSYIWRNLGVLIGFWLFFLFTYLFAAGLNIATSDVIESLTFLRGRIPKCIPGNASFQLGESGPQIHSSQHSKSDLEIRPVPRVKKFSWHDIIYDIGPKNCPKRLLNKVSGYAESGSLTALMGVSGAGNPTLLDALTRRLSAGTVGGHLAIDNVPVGRNFESKIGKFNALFNTV